MTTFVKNKLDIWQTWEGLPVEAFPVQIRKSAISDTLPRPIVEEAYKEYVAQHGSLQSLDRLGERGGFGNTELIVLLYERIKKWEGYQKTLESLLAEQERVMQAIPPCPAHGDRCVPPCSGVGKVSKIRSNGG